MSKEYLEKKLIAKAFGHEIYITDEFRESLKKLDLTEEQEKQLLSNTIDKISKSIRSWEEVGRKKQNK